MRFLATAQAFGYGPASKIKTVSNYLQEVSTSSEIVYAADGTAYTFGSRATETFDDVVSTDETSISELLDEQQFEAVISGMKPAPLLEADERDIPGFMVDSLFWFWKWGNSEELLNEFENEGVTRERYESLTAHDKKLAGHYVAEHSYLQHYPNETRTDIDIQRIGSATKTNPIVDKTGPLGDGRDNVIISLCGQLSPAVSKSQAVEYAETLLRTIAPELEAFEQDGYEIIVTGNPNVIEDVHSEFELSTLNHDEMMKNLSTAAVLLCPPSITSLYEALVLDVPVFFLPEQHTGHWENYRRVIAAANDDSYPSLTLSEHVDTLQSFRDEVTGGIEADEQSAAADGIHDYIKDQTAVELREQFDDLQTLSSLTESSTRESILDGQQSILKHDTTESGGQTIATHILDAIQ